MVKTCKHHGFRIRSSQQNQSNDYWGWFPQLLYPRVGSALMVVHDLDDLGVAPMTLGKPPNGIFGYSKLGDLLSMVSNQLLNMKPEGKRLHR